MTTFRLSFNDSTAQAVYFSNARDITKKFDLTDTDFDASQLELSDEVTIRSTDGQIVGWVTREQ